MVGFGLSTNAHCKSAFFAPEREGGGAAGQRRDSPDEHKRITVALIDDRALFGESLATAINAQSPDFAVKHWRSADVLVDVGPALRGVDLVLVSIGRSNPTKGSTLQMIKALLERHEHPPIAILADAISPAMVRVVMRMGLRGIVTSATSLHALINAMRQIHRGATVIPTVN